MPRKLFGTDGIRGKFGEEPVTLTTAAKLGRAVVDYFGGEEKPSQIVIGRDTRESGSELESALIEGITSRGGEIVSLGVVPTPTVAYITKVQTATAGIVISASHNPYWDNGLKIFAVNGYKLSDEIETELEKLILADDYVLSESESAPETIGDEKYRQQYIEFAQKSVGDLGGLKIALDCANGAAHQLAPQIFRELGAEVTVINDQPDGKNINDNCGSQFLSGLQKTVVAKSCNIGIAFDGDADRVIICDEKGRELSGDHILALGGLDLLEKDELPQKTIVATEYSNLGLDKLMESRGVEVVRVLNGDRYVIEEMRKNGYILGGERSGHIIFGQLATTGDGIIAALQMVALLKNKNQPLSELADVLEEYPQALVSVLVAEKKDLIQLKQTQQAIKQAETELGDRGRVLARYSGTENKARVLVEGRDQKTVTELAKEIAKVWQEEVSNN
ncbi:MAG: phosphoglucosamine mutase [Parcubacteria group bacterium]|nr:phosphoglucosamine mutase [Parcubacteria group bacterium]